MRKITFSIVCFVFAFTTVQGQISTVPITGYTEDIVANGVGPMASSTTIPADADSFCLISEDWILQEGDPPISVGLPANGQIPSSNVTGLVYQIPTADAPYEGNNSLRINQSGSANAGTVTLVSPAAYSSLYFLVFSGNGDSDMDVTVNFEDATSETFSNNIVPDWYGTGLPVEIQGFGRGDIDNNNVETPAGNPKLFLLQVDIDESNQTKNVVSVTFTRNNPDTDDTVFNMIAVSGMAAVDCPPPSDISVSSITENSAEIAWNSTGTATEWEIEYGPTGFAQGSGTTLTDSDGTPQITITGLSSCTAYDVYVRTLCSGGGESTWAGPETFSTDGSAITSFPFTESFEDGSPYRDCWTNVYVSGTQDWEYTGTNQDGSITPNTGTLMADFSIANPSGETTKLVSPPLDLTEVSNPQLVFYYANVASGGNVDELRVYYRTASIFTWTQIGTDYISEHTSWTEVTLDLPSSSETSYIAFEGTSNSGGGVDVDDVWIGEGSTSGIEDQGFENFSYYPNPATTTLSLEATKKIEQVVIFDLLGQVVLKTRPDTSTPSIGLTDLQPGVYLMKVSIEGTTGTYKFVKK